MEETQDEHKKTLILNVLNFLKQDLSELSADQKESVEIAIPCLENAFDISKKDKKNLQKIDLLNHVCILNLDLMEEQQLIAEHHKSSAKVAMGANKFQDAIDEFSKAIELNPKNAVYYCDRAVAYSRINNNEEAIKDCQQAINIDPTCSGAYERLGIIYSSLNNWEQAVRAYLGSLKYTPNHTDSQKDLRVATEHLINSMQSVVLPHHRSITEIMDNELFLSMVTELMEYLDAQNIIWGVMVMSQSDDTNFELFLKRETRIRPMKCRPKT